MKLKDHVEGCCLLLNAAALGPFVVDEETGELINKTEIEHFVIVHAFRNQDELNDGLLPKKKKYSKKSTEPSNESEEDRMAEQAAFEEDDDEALGRDEEVAHLTPDKELRTIAVSRKINQPSVQILGDDGWFLCPIYSGMTELRPMIIKALDRKKGYQCIISKKAIFSFDSVPFNDKNLKDWDVNSLFILNELFDKNNDRYGFYAESVFLHKKINMSKRDLKAALSRLETTQRGRIKIGNNLVDESLLHVGQERYITNKEKIVLLKKDKKNANDLKDYDLKEVKIIDSIYQSYIKLNKKAEQLGKKVPINREDTFEAVLKAVTADDELDHELMALKVLFKRLIENGQDVSKDDIPAKDDENFDEKLNGLRKHYEDTPDFKQAYEDTDLMMTKEYISTYITYINVKIYANALANENDARTVVTKLVHDTKLWGFAEGVSGFGEITCAYLEANIDWRSAVHASSVIRYLGMDNVTDIPKRKDSKGHDIFMQDSDVKRYIEMINLDLARKFALKNEKQIDEINHETFDFYLKSDAINNYGDFITAFKFYKNEFSGLHIAEKEDKIDNLDMAYLAEKYPEYSEMLMRFWTNFDVVYVQVNGHTIPAVKKRARHRGDLVTSSYIDKNGKVKFKKSMGYNPKVKSRIIEIGFESMMRAGNEYYVGNLYTNKKKQYQQRCIVEGKDPEKYKMVNHLRARRFAVQVLLEDAWKYMRRELGLPLNGGTYYEAKLHGSHGHGFDPAITA